MMFTEGTKVRLKKTGNSDLDGLVGVVCGVGKKNDIDLPGWGSYIIKFEDKNLEKLHQNDYEYSCIHITDACVEKI